MSCWVVPEVAADLWNIPVEQILERIADGTIASKREGDFVFIDVNPQFSASPAEDPMSSVPENPSNAPSLIFQHPRWEAERDQIAHRRRPPQAA